LAIILNLLFVSANHRVDAVTAAVNFTMFQSLIGYKHVDVVYWTLAIELQFYILMGMILCIRAQRHVT